MKANCVQRPFGMVDKIGYMFGDFGNDFTFILSSMFLMKFYTDVMGVDGAVVGLMMMLARFVDAFTDITMGQIVDRSTPRERGKFLPWVRRMCGPVAVASLLMYATWFSGMPLMFTRIKSAISEKRPFEREVDRQIKQLKADLNEINEKLGCAPKVEYRAISAAQKLVSLGEIRADYKHITPCEENPNAIQDSIKKMQQTLDELETQQSNDLNQLSTMALRVKEIVKPGEMAVVADTGYYNAPEIKDCVDAGITVYIKKGKGNNSTKENGYRKEKFLYDSKRNAYICPEGKELPFFENTSKNGLKYQRYKCEECQKCPEKKNCTTSKSGRSIQRWEHEEVLEKVGIETAEHRDIYKQRRCIVEHPFGTIKRQLGYTFFLRKGTENVNAECASMFIAYNLKRLFGMFTVPELKKKFETCRV